MKKDLSLSLLLFFSFFFVENVIAGLPPPSPEHSYNELPILDKTQRYSDNPDTITTRNFVSSTGSIISTVKIVIIVLILGEYLIFKRIPNFKKSPPLSNEGFSIKPSPEHSYNELPILDKTLVQEWQERAMNLKLLYKKIPWKYHNE